MITHPKVRIHQKNSYISSWGEGQQVVFYPAGQIPATASFCSINEYDGIMIEFVEGHPDDLLYMDHFSEDTEQILRPGENSIVVSPEDTMNMPSPGHYTLRVEGPSGIWECLYIVEPRHLDWKYIYSLRNYLEERVSGITYDLIRRRSGMWAPEVGQEPHWFNMFRNVMEKTNKIRRQMELILQEPFDGIEKVYKKQVLSRHPDRKSQRWLQGKGLAKNSNPIVPTQFYEKRSVLTLDIPENRWLLWFMRYLQRQLNDISLRFEMWERSKQEEYAVESSRFENVQEELSSHKGMYFQTAFKKRNSDLFSQVKQLEKKLKKITSELSRFETNKRDLHKMIGWLSKTIHTTWLADVSEIKNKSLISLRLLKDSRYNSLYRIYLQLKDNLKRDKSTRKNTYPYLGTAKLMEVYTVCLVTEIFQELGWQWESGWVAGFRGEIPTFSELRSGETLHFSSENYHLELAYDNKIARYADDNHVGFEAATLHDSPDLLISLYDTKNMFLKAMVVEVKHRNYVYLVHPQAKEQSTDVNEQLKAYTSIFFHCTQRNTIIRDAVDRVLCVYPRQEKGKPYEERYRKMIQLIQIEPAVNKDDFPFGYNSLLEQIRTFFLNHAPSLIMGELS